MHTSSLTCPAGECGFPARGSALAVKELPMPTAQDILARKGSLVYSIAPDATVLEATNRMNHHKIGALIVMNDGQMVGIFTERDVLRRVVGSQLDPAKVKVFDVMSADLVTCTPTTDMD